MAELLFKNEVYAIVGAAMEVYNQLGPDLVKGFIRRHWKSNQIYASYRTTLSKKSILIIKA
jgi:hypothetical protein